MASCLFPVVLVKEKRVKGPNGEGFTRLVPCGKCFECLQKRRNDWTFRISKELEVSTAAHFITLTYDEDNLPRDENDNPCVEVKDVQLFFKRLRKKIHPFKVRYFLTSEYGGKTYRPHYHLILFNFPDSYNVLETIESTWSNGFVVVDKVTPARIRYVTKYCLQDISLPDLLRKPFMTCSKRPSIGSNYMKDKIIKYHKKTLETTVMLNGYKYRMPKYYQDRIFNDDEKLQIRMRNLAHGKKKLEEFYEKYKDYDILAVENGSPTMMSQYKMDSIRRLKQMFNKDKL